MIDVVFLLLVFFVWTASFQIMEYILPTEVSAADSGTAEDMQLPPDQIDFEPVVIQILWQDERPQWIVSETPVDSLAQVRQVLAHVAQVKADLPIIIDPQSGVPFGNVIDVYDVSQMAGFHQIQFAIEQDESQF